MSDKEQKIQELQFFEQNLQNILYQKQAFELELSETQSAMEELKNSNGEVFKIVGQLMIKSSSQKIKEELDNKEKLILIRIKSLEKQEKEFNEKVSFLREEIINSKK
ncbi:prefoldin subunit [Candidatus Pacearchaeota archaeon]|nr:prefoldin subunit [Candidatus Pacearchaeota archaeon]